MFCHVRLDQSRGWTGVAFRGDRFFFRTGLVRVRAGFAVPPGVTLDRTSFSWAATMSSRVSRPPGRYSDRGGELPQAHRRIAMFEDEAQPRFADRLHRLRAV